MNGPQSALQRLRGEFPGARLNARRVASIVEAPGCVRRTVLDAAGVDTTFLVQQLGFKRDRQSPLAISRAAQFEALLERDGRAQLIQLARRHLDLELSDVRVKDLSVAGTRSQVRIAADTRRTKLTKQELGHILRREPGAANLLVKPLTTLTIGNLEAQLEQDVLAFAEQGALHVVAIRNFYMTRDDADPTLVGQAARETAVHVLSLQRMAEALGCDRAQISTKVLLVLPRDLLFVPTGVVIDVADEVEHLEQAIGRIGDIEDLAESLDLIALPPPPETLSSEDDHEQFRGEVRGALRAMPMRFGDGCVSCAMFRSCRQEAEAERSTARLGSVVAGLCGETGSIDAVLDLVEGRRAPQSISEAAISDVLQRASRAIERAEIAGVA